jgi:hypothetical protein
MKTSILAVFLFTVSFSAASYAGDRVTEYTQKFGNGTFTRRSDGSTMTTQPFGSGTISRESFRSGRSATHITSRFGSGYLRRSTGSYVRRP